MNCSILMIEDSKDIHSLVEFHLRNEGWIIEHAFDAVNGLEMARSLDPTLILMDLDLPDMTGVEVCRQLQAHPSLRRVPVIFISSHSNPLEIAEALDAGGIDYITKPFNPVDIRARVRAGIRLKQNADALAESNAKLQEAFARDIRRTRELLLQAENMATIGNLVTSIGTELTGPAEFVRTAILNLSQEHSLMHELVDTGGSSDDPLRAHLSNRRTTLNELTEDAELAVTHMLQVSIALSHQGRADMTPSPDTAIEDIIEEALIICRGRLENIEVKLDISETPTLTCRRSQIGQVLIKLLSFSSDVLRNLDGQAAPVIRIETQAKKQANTEGVTIRLGHNGPESAGLRQVFAADDTADYSTSDSLIGMALCREVIEEHDGAITLSIEESLGGCLFEIWLPLTQSES